MIPWYAPVVGFSVLMVGAWAIVTSELVVQLPRHAFAIAWVGIMVAAALGCVSGVGFTAWLAP